MSQSEVETLLATHIKWAGLPVPRREFRFHPIRRWRADFAWPDRKLLVEVEGGVWSQGRHVRGRGFQGDCQKYNAAAMGGWMVLRFTPDMVLDGSAIADILCVLRGGDHD